MYNDTVAGLDPEEDILQGVEVTDVDAAMAGTIVAVCCEVRAVVDCLSLVEVHRVRHPHPERLRPGLLVHPGDSEDTLGGSGHWPTSVAEADVNLSNDLAIHHVAQLIVALGDAEYTAVDQALLWELESLAGWLGRGASAARKHFVDQLGPCCATNLAILQKTEVPLELLHRLDRSTSETPVDVRSTQVADQLQVLLCVLHACASVLALEQRTLGVRHACVT